MRNVKAYNKQRGKTSGRRGKETEVNIEDADINKSDLAGFSGKGRKSGKNDPAWYAKSPALLRDAASFPYSWPVGSKITWDAPDTLDHVWASIPGIMTIHYTPAIGRSTNEYSPINVAARNLYTMVRKANSGQANYETTDLMMYMMAMDTSYQHYAYMVRAYGTATLFSNENRYIGKALLQAQGFDAEDIYRNLAQLRYHINLYAYKLSQMAVPSGMSIFQRHTWMASGIYTDSNTPKAQLYLFVPHVYYTLVEVTEGPGYLYAQQYPTKITLAQLETISNAQLETILASQDFNIMSGDIVKAFGEGNLYSAGPITEDYVVLPTYNQEVLMQIENAVAVGMPADPFGKNAANSNNISQKQNDLLESYLYYNPKMRIDAIGGTETFKTGPLLTFMNNCAEVMDAKRLINMHHADVKPEDTMVATRLTYPTNSVINDLNTSTMIVQPLSFGSELVNFFKIHQFTDWDKGVKASWTMRSTTMYHINPYLLLWNTDKTDRTNTKQRLSNAEFISQFDWNPTAHKLVYLPTSSYTGALADIDWLLLTSPKDVDMYTTMDEHDLERLNEVALLSMFDISSRSVGR